MGLGLTLWAVEEREDDIPADGWALARVEDLGSAVHECIYCRNEHVRYVHVITHPAAGVLRVGCICAGKLTGDIQGAQATETTARNRAKRFANWCDQARWTIEEDRQTRSGKYSHWQYVITVFRVEGGWKWMVLFSDREFLSERTFAGPDEAKRDFYMTQIE